MIDPRVIRQWAADEEYWQNHTAELRKERDKLRVTVAELLEALKGARDGLENFGCKTPKLDVVIAKHDPEHTPQEQKDGDDDLPEMP